MILLFRNEMHFQSLFQPEKKKRKEKKNSPPNVHVRSVTTTVLLDLVNFMEICILETLSKQLETKTTMGSTMELKSNTRQVIHEKHTAKTKVNVRHSIIC